MKTPNDSLKAKKEINSPEKMNWITPELKKFSRKGIIKGGNNMGLLENVNPTTGADYKTS